MTAKSDLPGGLGYGLRGAPWMALIAAVLVVGLISTAGAANELPGLEFVEPDDLSLTLKEGATETEPVTLWLRNTGGADLEPHLALRLENGDGREISVHAEEVKASGDDTVPAGGLARMRVVVTDPDPTQDDLSGQLVATAEGAAPATIDVKLGREEDENELIDKVLVLPAIIALGLVGVRWGVLRVSPKNLVAEVDLDFSKGFASSLTLVGAVLGTILAAGVLPEDTERISKEAYTALNVVFGVLVVVAGLVYAAVQRRVKEGDEWKLYGYVGTFMLASWLTAWAVFGELYCLFLIGDELESATGFTPLGVSLFKFVLVGAALAMLVYLWRRIKQIATPGGVSIQAPRTAAARPSWSL
jgi:hypothetical protein